MENKLLSYKEFLANQSVQVDLSAFAINLILAIIFAQLLSFLYCKYGRALSNRKEFSKNFVLLSMTTMIIISIVKASLALSLGLVGALSIVRFRSAIKEPEELTYLFFCIAIGLGLGADQRLTVGTAMVIVSIVIIAKGFLDKRTDNSNFYLNISSSNTDKITGMDLIEKVKPHSARLVLRRYDQGKSQVNVTFAAEFAELSNLHSAIEDLKSISKDIEVSYVENTGIM